jgi:hypothetical protein
MYYSSWEIWSLTTNLHMEVMPSRDRKRRIAWHDCRLSSSPTRLSRTKVAWSLAVRHPWRLRVRRWCFYEGGSTGFGTNLNGQQVFFSPWAETQTLTFVGLPPLCSLYPADPRISTPNRNHLSFMDQKGPYCKEAAERGYDLPHIIIVRAL